MDAHAHTARSSAHDGLRVFETCTRETRWSFGLLVADFGTYRHGKFRPSFDVGKGGGDDEGIGVVRRIECDDSGSIRVLDIAEVGQSKAVDQIAGCNVSRGISGNTTRTLYRSPET